MRFLLFVILGANSVLAGAAVTCEQLANTAVAAQQLRDKGYTLAEVVEEVGKLEPSEKITAQDIEYVKGVVERAYNGSLRTPLDILQECKDKPPH